MTLGIIKRITPNFSFRIPFFDGPNWGRELERNFDTIDAVLFAATGFSNVKGVWTNNTEYDASDRVVDPADGSVWQANVTHTSASTGTFEDDRTLHPTYWTQLSQTVGFRGQWTTATNYNINEFLYDDHRYGATLTKYTSGASYNADVAAGKILTLIDLKAPYDETVANAASALASKNAAATSAAAALVSENNADASEAAALASQNAAATSATNANTSATNAATSAAAALSSEINSAANGLIVSMFTFSTTVSYPPASTQVRTNNANQTLATRLDVSHLNNGGTDVTQIFLLQIQAGTLILLQDRSTPANYQVYTATGPSVVSGSDLQIPVVWKSGGTAIANGRPMLFGIGGGGGAASVTTDDNPPAAPLRDGQLWFKSSTGVFYVYYDDGNTSQWVQIGSSQKQYVGDLNFVSSMNGGPLAGFRNAIGNPRFFINQPNTAFNQTLGANAQYVDYWKAGAAGCTLTVSAGIATITAGSLVQIVESLDLVSGRTYVISWSGTATCTIDGVAKNKGDTIVATSANITVAFSGGTLTEAQLEPGSTVTPFEKRPQGIELAICKWRFEAVTICAGGYQGVGGVNFAGCIPYSMKRVLPTVTTPTIITSSNVSSATVTNTSQAYGATYSVVGTGAGSATVLAVAIAFIDARL